MVCPPISCACVALHDLPGGITQHDMLHRRTQRHQPRNKYQSPMACNGNNRVVFRYMIDKRLRFIEKTENPLSKNIEMRIGIHTETNTFETLVHGHWAFYVRWLFSPPLLPVIFKSNHVPIY